MLTFLKRSDVKLILFEIFILIPIVMVLSPHKLFALGSNLLVLSLLLATLYRHQPDHTKTITVGVIALAGLVTWVLLDSNGLIPHIVGGTIYFLAIMVYRLHTQQPAS
jgi:hypothetical protein